MKRNRRLSRREFLGAAAGATTTVLLASWSQPTATAAPAPAAAATKADAQELRVAANFFAASTAGSTPGDLAELDPARRGNWSWHSLLWTNLLAQDTAGNILKEKSLAESWEISSSGTVYTFHLRKGARFSDGTPLTSKDVAGVYGYLSMMNYKEAAGFRDNFPTVNRLLYDIVGIKDQKATFDNNDINPVAGIKAPDNNTVVFTLTAPSATFLKRLGTVSAIFRLKDLTDGKGKKLDLLDWWTAHAVYSGPYKITEAVPGDHYTMVPNEYYFGPKPQLTKITVRMVSQDPNTVMTAFANKELDIVGFPLQGDQARQAFADPKLADSLVEMPTWLIMQFWMTPNPPLDDRAVRRAISMAVDKEGLIKLLNAGAPKVLFRTVNMHRNPRVPHCEAETAKVRSLPFNPTQAKAELAKSKYGAGVLDMEIHILSQAASDLAQCEALQNMLQQNLGFKKVTVHTEKVPDLTNPPFPLHLWNNTQQPWIPDLFDTLNNMTLYIPDKEWTADRRRSYVAVSYEPDLKNLVNQGLAENDPAKRCQLVQQSGQMWSDVAFSLDFGVPVQYYLIAPYVKDLSWYGNAGQGKPLSIEKVWVAKH